MRWNIAAECVSTVMLLIIWGYSRKGFVLQSLKNRMFQLCFLVTFCSMSCNIVATWLLGHPGLLPNWFCWGINLVYFVATPLMGLVYYFYVTATVCEEKGNFAKNAAIGSILGVLYLVLVLITPFTGALFHISGKGVYSQGPLIAVTYVVFYVYAIFCVLQVVCNKKYVDVTVGRILVSFPLIAIATVVVQQFYPDIILSGSAATSSLLMVYLYLQNKQISMDYLTGLPNRTELQRVLDYMVRRDKGSLTLMVISLREFKQINDSFGQHCGDQLLRAIAAYLQTLSPLVRSFRYGGDEFALLVQSFQKEELEKIYHKLSERMQQPWQAGDLQCVLRYTMGVAAYPDSSDTTGGLINCIDYAISRAKGANMPICYCGSDMLRDIKRKIQVAEVLRQVCRTGEFEMHYQPIVDTSTGEVVLAESLLRIPNSFIGPLYPNEFIPIAEDTGIIAELTYVALAKVCTFIKELEIQDLSLSGIHVNFSGVQFRQPDLVQRIIDVLEQQQVAPDKIKIEITESTLVDNSEVVEDFAIQMHRMGVSLGLDDFGTGYSNINSVMQMPLDVIKIDKSLLWSAMTNHSSALMLRSLVSTFHALGQCALVEGVETPEQDRLVKEFGVDLIQGYLYAKPMPGEAFIQFLREYRPSPISK